MDLQPYVERVQRDLAAAAAPGGTEHGELADRLSRALESSLRLALLEALAEAAEQITRELAPESVDVRLRGRDPEFIVSATAPAEPEPVAAPEAGDDDTGTWRVTLRLPASLRAAVEAAAGADGLSVNAWLVRAASAALSTRRPGRSRSGSERHVSGWVR